jgi:hypothetical protein
VAESCGDELLARRAYDLAGGAVVRRALEIERSMLELPELADPHPEDVASLAAWRARWQRDKSRFLQAVAHLLCAAGGDAFLRADDDGLLRVCAWCLSVRRPGGAWMPFGHLVSGEADDRVTHGICAPCSHAMAEADALLV